ncbi:2-succinyl-6-hydroxy-2,4-cyclohexadiene-1-carboxylate synthase [Vibrio sp.]|nr:2-succinyl-6-hydroxy-2,4-cyclohexadiene-1-carboxylate synthase [Vibrio sp.]
MLYSHYQPAKTAGSDKPTLVFLHGLLGSGNDWNEVIEHLGDYPTLTIDLCGHGRSRYKQCQGFEHVSRLIEASIAERVGTQTPVVLVAYSLGARIAMYAIARKIWATINVAGVIIEGGNFGLQTDKEKTSRWIHDVSWAKRFCSEHIEQVLDDWYHQPVFSSLNHEQRQIMVELRSANLGVTVADMLLATSLAKQPYLLEELKSQSTPMIYFCGEKDSKFRTIASNSGLHIQLIDGAGHNAHKEQSQRFAENIDKFICNTLKVNSSQ